MEHLTVKEPWQITREQIINTEPWQMTKKQYKEALNELSYIGDDWGKAGDDFRWAVWKLPEEALKRSAKSPDYWMNLHKEQIQQALSEGKPVSPEVLKDYPGLAQFSPPAIPKELQPLAEEAKKYKTAEEFEKFVLSNFGELRNITGKILEAKPIIKQVGGKRYIIIRDFKGKELFREPQRTKELGDLGKQVDKGVRIIFEQKYGQDIKSFYNQATKGKHISFKHL